MEAQRVLQAGPGPGTEGSGSTVTADPRPGGGAELKKRRGSSRGAAPALRGPWWTQSSRLMPSEAPPEKLCSLFLGLSQLGAGHRKPGALWANGAVVWPGGSEPPSSSHGGVHLLPAAAGQAALGVGERRSCVASLLSCLGDSRSAEDGGHFPACAPLVFVGSCDSRSPGLGFPAEDKALFGGARRAA